MRKSRIFLLLAVVTTALFLSACQKDASLESPDMSGLYLKSAAANDMASVIYFSQGQIQKMSYPDNLLFSVNGSEVAVLNNFWLKVDNFTALSDKEALFRVSPVNSKTTSMGEINGQAIYASNSENAMAVKLPQLDYGLQAATGAERFNGLLKADNYVLAVDGLNVKIYDLTSKEVTMAQAVASGEILTFTVAGLWSLEFVKTSPIGNIFTLSVGDSKIPAYSLRF